MLVVEEGVTGIGENAFFYLKNLTSVSLPESLTTIGWAAFADCTGLTSLVIPDGVTSIDMLAFDGCNSLTEVVLGDSVSFIGNSAFYGCTSLKSVTLGDSVKNIGSGAFSFCWDLTEIKLGSSLKWIGDEAFTNCYRLESVTFTGDAPSIGDDAFHYVTTTCRYPQGNTTWTEDVLQNYGGTLTWEAYTLGGGQCGTYMDWVLTADGILTLYGLGDMTAFSSPADAPWYENRGQIRRLVVEPGITSISDWAFSGCTELYSITFRGDAPAIGENTFSGVTATAFYPQNNATWTEDVMFPYGGNITWVFRCSGDHTYTSVVTEPTCTSQGYTTHTCTVCGYSFLTGYLEPVEHTLENGVCTVCGQLLGSASGTFTGGGYWLLNTEGTLEIHAFGAMEDYSSASATPWYAYASMITGVEVCAGVTAIGKNAFRDLTEVTEVSIASTVTAIGSSAFRGCTALMSVDIPKSATVGTYAFYKCTALESVVIPDISLVGEYAFTGCTLLKTAGPIGGDCDVQFGVSGYEIVSGAFAMFPAMTEIHLPNGITGIGSSAFADCTELEKITIPDTVTSMGSYVFSGCTSLTEVTLPEGLTSINTRLFENCTSLTGITIPDTVTTIWAGAFYGCTSLTAVDIPESVTSIYGGVFYGCTELNEVYIACMDAAFGDAVFTSYPTIYCYAGSTAETFGLNNECPYCAAPVGEELGHSYQTTVKEPSCTEQGYTTHTCQWCANSYDEDVVSATGHNYVCIEEPNCINNGKATYECSICGDTYRYGSFIHDPDSLHVYVVVVTAPTCTERGYTTYTCSLCGATKVDDYAAALGHDYGEWILDRERDCTQDGQSHRECFRCGDTETQIHEATGHSYEETITAPTCTEQGYTTHTCTVCGDSYVDSYTNALGHSYENGVCAICGAEDASIVLGDINGDGTVDIFDANLAVAYYNESASLTDEQLAAADVNGDGAVDIFDANLIVAYYNESIESFPAGKP